jgi:hypothetical protein
VGGLLRGGYLGDGVGGRESMGGVWREYGGSIGGGVSGGAGAVRAETDLGGRFWRVTRGGWGGRRGTTVRTGYGDKGGGYPVIFYISQSLGEGGNRCTDWGGRGTGMGRARVGRG